jgi:hypothetical protein
MGQIGSYVPAKSAKLGMLDAVFTRMGAHDNMMAGEVCVPCPMQLVFLSGLLSNPIFL